MIRRKRAEAEAKLGSGFDQRWFNDAILGLGAVPLPVLEQQLDAWMATGGKNPNAAAPHDVPKIPDTMLSTPSAVRRDARDSASRAWPCQHASGRTVEELARLHGVSDVPVVSGAAAGFRHRARLAIRGRRNSPKIGLFELGTHRVVHNPNCVIHHPLINRVAGIVRRALVDSKVSPYSDAAHLGVARYLQVVIERQSQTAQVTLVANSPDPASLTECLDLIRDRAGAGLHSLWFNSNQERANTVLRQQISLQVRAGESVV